MQHTVQKYGGEMLLEDSVGQLRSFNRQACVSGPAPGQHAASASGRTFGRQPASELPCPRRLSG